VNSSPPDSIVEGYELALQLYYYYPHIQGPVGKGTVPVNRYSSANAAEVPLGGLIGSFIGMKYDIRLDASTHDGYPEVKSGWRGATPLVDMRANLYDNLQKYWKVQYEYTNPKGNGNLYVDAAWPKYLGTWNTWGLRGLTDADDDDLDAGEGRQDRECTVTFNGLPSLEYEEQEVPFRFWMIP